MDFQTSIWPYDVLNDVRPPDRDNLNHLSAFLICSFNPKDLADCKW